ncbi:MAG TPA: thioredoxin domain-containing protein [Candidatus Saccharimonadales bacterium]
MEKRFWVIIGVIIVVFVGILMLGGKDDKKDTNGGNGTQPTNHVKGKLDSKVKLVEYGDFQCPGCGSYYPIVSQILSKYQDKISFQFRNLPLTQIHQHAFAAARAAEAANAQGKFWEMYDMLYANQQSWSASSRPTDSFKQYATQLGLNADQFQKDFSSSKANDVINADIAAFKKTGQSLGTPTFFLNGKKINLKDVSSDQSVPSFEKFAKLLDDELAKN